MAKVICKKYDLSGKAIGEVEIDYGEEPSVKGQLIKDYIVALRANARQWSANTKGRSESNHSGIKPHPQKGTGKARQGFLGAPQYKGGGRVGGPKPKFDQHVRINQKERRAAIRALLVDKLNKGDVIILQPNLEKEFAAPKTKKVQTLMNVLGWEEKKVACLGVRDPSLAYENFKLSLRNIPKVTSLMCDSVNGYNMMNTQKIIILEEALENFKLAVERA